MFRRIFEKNFGCFKKGLRINNSSVNSSILSGEIPKSFAQTSVIIYLRMRDK